MDAINTYQHLWLYTILVVGIVALPGLDMGLILSKTLAQGPRHGWATLGGVIGGVAVYVVLTLLGLGLLLTHTAWAYRALLLGGAAYLAWMGWGLCRSGAVLKALPISTTAATTAAASTGHLAWPRSAAQGFATALLNPKAAVFMVAIFPQFLRPNAGSLAWQGFLMGSIIAVAQALIYGALVVGASGLYQTLARHPQRQKRVAQAMGVLLIVSAIWTASTGWSSAPNA